MQTHRRRFAHSVNPPLLRAVRSRIVALKAIRLHNGPSLVLVTVRLRFVPLLTELVVV